MLIGEWAEAMRHGCCTLKPTWLFFLKGNPYGSDLEVSVTNG